MSGTLFFYLSKVIWTAIRPESWFLLLLALVIYWVSRGRRRPALIGLSCAFLGMGTLMLFPLGDLVLRPLEARMTAPGIDGPVDGIIILGGPEERHLSHAWGQPVLGGGAERLTAGIALAHRYPAAKIVVTGGSGSLTDQTLRGAYIAADVLIGAGVDAQRIRIEDAARNTHENATLSKASLKPLDSETWLLVTSAYHMPRSVGVFCAIGWRVTPYPVDYRAPKSGLKMRINLASNLLDLNAGLREWVGLLAYRATGKIDTVFPQSC